VTRYRVSVLPLAEEDVREAFLWYSERSPIAADAFRSEVFAAIDKVAEDPTMWPAAEDGVHHYVLRRFPYTVHYEFDTSTLTVLAVAHHRRRPGYWGDR
jgi:plasmid stabilization system protein ParE